MVVCKFFLQGTCKFGDFCKFEHQLNDYTSYQNSTSILRQSHFGAPQQAQPSNNPSTVDTTTLVKSVVNDMTTAEKGGQWLLSCYAPFKEKPVFPGFEDQSFEEVRLGYYEAVKNGTVEQYKQQVQMMLQQAIMKLKSLQSPSPDIVNVLKSIYNTPPSSSSGVFGGNSATANNVFANAPNTQINFGQQQPTTFGQQSGSSMFAQANQNIFSKPPQSQNTFAGTSNSIFQGASQNVNTFGGQANNSLFGNSQVQPQATNKSIFGQTNANFAGQGTGSIFGGQQSGMQTSTGSIFGGALPSNNPIFERQPGAPSVFAQQNTAMPFASQSQVQTGAPNIFAKPFEQTNPISLQTNLNTFVQPTQGAPNLFGAPPNVQANQDFMAPTMNQNMPQQTSTNIFGGAAANQTQSHTYAPATEASIFSQQGGVNLVGQQNSNSIFGQPIKTTADAQSHSSSIFGNSQQVGTNPTFGQAQQPQQIDETLYSKLEDLTEEEIKWFESDDLDIMNIPEKPPTYQMCFKT